MNDGNPGLLSGPVAASGTEPAAPQRLQRAEGRLDMKVKLAGGRTRLEDLHQAGCLKLRFPKVAGATSEAVLINTSGGRGMAL